MIRTFAITEVRRRYKSSTLGFAWTILEPLLLLSVLVLVFSYIYKSGQPLPHYVLYLLINLTLWHYFVRATTLGMNSIVSRGRMILQVYFPREILPLSSSVTSFIFGMFDLAIFFVFLVVLQFIPTQTIFFLPVAVLLEFILILGISFALSVLNVYFRDLQHIWAVIVYVGFFISPIMYTFNRLPDNIRSLVMLNPMAQIIEMAHNAVLFNTLPGLNDFIYVVVLSLSILIMGALIFRALEPRVAQEI